MNTFLKEALATATQGNEDLREMVGQHEAVAMEAATRIDEIVAEQNSYFTNARNLTKHFREMQQKYKAPQEINLASLAALKECLANKSGGHANTTTTQQTNAARGEPSIQGISPNSLIHAPSGSGTGPRTSLPQVPMPRTSTQTQALGRQGGLSVQTSGHANDNVPWPPHHQHANPDLALQPQVPEPTQGAGQGVYQAGAGPSTPQVPRTPSMGSFRNLELCRRPPPCPFGNACRNVHASQGKNIGIINNTKTNPTLYRRTHQSYIHEPKRPAKEDTEEEHISKKEESEVHTPAPGLRPKSDQLAMVLRLLDGDRR